MQRTAYEALQIAGGNGYMRELPYEQYVRDARILPIFEGANEILRLFIALSALKDVGASLSELRSALGSIFNEPIKGFGVLSGYAERRFARATGLGSGGLKVQLDPELRRLADIYANYARAAARVAEAALRTYGKGISEQQYVQKRIADLLIDLFVGLCVISRANALMASRPDTRAQLLDVARVFTHQARRRMVRNVRGAAHNEDKAVDALAGAVLERGSYPWDVL
jgi:alkylation response protein AidB-like acyl-CoA dehydrogenase